MRMSDWSSDVCSSDLRDEGARHRKQRLAKPVPARREMPAHSHSPAEKQQIDREEQPHAFTHDGRVPSEKPLSRDAESGQNRPGIGGEENERGERRTAIAPQHRSEEHTSEFQSLMRISSAAFCLK